MLRARMGLIALIAGTAVLMAAPLQGKEKHTYAESKEKNRYTEPLSETFPLETTGRLSVENINGWVRITTWDRNEVKIDAVKSASSPERLEDLVIHMSADDDHVRVEARFEREHNKFHNGDETRVDFEIKVPPTIRIDEISLVNGDLTIADVEGSVRASTVNGQLSASGLSNDVDLSTVNGTLQVTFDRLDASASVKLQTVNGTVDVIIPKNVGLRVTASTVNGSIKNDLGLAVAKHDVVGSSLKGTVGDGGASLDVDAVNGTIRIRGEDGER